MAKNLEIEAKYLIDKNDYLKLVNHFKIDSYFIQTNYYFDTINYDLINHHAAMRVRLLPDNTYEATTKIPYKEGLLETNIAIDKTTFNKLLKNDNVEIKELENVLHNLNLSLKDLHFIASLTTKRATIPYKNGELFFDESSYLNIVDYEIEYEVNTNLEDAYNDLNTLFKQINITSFHKGYSKIKRCIEAKNKTRE
ncbi:MAG: CYTH domain-containing protein [Bacilli bacterium]|nr:CYTH domain-containing protein [Bacilli bacterium]